MSTDNRPTSPHVDIYRWRITMLTSIIHRASGAYVSFGLAILAIWLACIASGGISGFSETGFIGTIFWFSWTAAIYYHLCNGIRHLVWDTGNCFSLESSAKSGKIVFIAAAIMTIFTWIIVLV